MKTLSVIALLTISANAQNQPLVFQSPATRTALLELFTSEGCSSCPPAETWLTSLKTSPGLWKEFVPVAFHVDYWDHLGWRDPWSSREFSDRQRAYAASWSNNSVYTPGFVLTARNTLTGRGSPMSSNPLAHQPGRSRSVRPTWTIGKYGSRRSPPPGEL